MLGPCGTSCFAWLLPFFPSTLLSNRTSQPGPAECAKLSAALPDGVGSVSDSDVQDLEISYHFLHDIKMSANFCQIPA